MNAAVTEVARRTLMPAPAHRGYALECLYFALWASVVALMVIVAHLPARLDPPRPAAAECVATISNGGCWYLENGYWRHDYKNLYGPQQTEYIGRKP